MQELASEERADWCDRQGILVTESGLRFKNSREICLTISRLYSKKVLTKILSHLLYEVPGDETFDGALLWVEDDDHFDDFWTHVARTMHRQLNRTAAAVPAGGRYPIQCFDRDELYEFHAAALVPLLSPWDAHIVPADKDFFVYVSHEEVVSIVCRNEETANALDSRLSEQYAVDESRAWYFGLTQFPSLKES